MPKNIFKNARIEKGYSQEELAQKLGVSRIYVAKLETKKKSNPSTKLLSKIKDVLGIEVLNHFI